MAGMVPTTELWARNQLFLLPPSVHPFPESPFVLKGSLGCPPLGQQSFISLCLWMQTCHPLSLGIQFPYLLEDEWLSQLSRDALSRFQRVWVPQRQCSGC